mmetsp:Transcript_21341/g.18943  ORF Transcript_21341/g.18943 Transcript_21341/m.18943 type:complete len:91 (+) Transcript_21341:493-765(+)
METSRGNTKTTLTKNKSLSRIQKIKEKVRRARNRFFDVGNDNILPQCMEYAQEKDTKVLKGYYTNSKESYDVGLQNQIENKYLQLKTDEH